MKRQAGARFDFGLERYMRLKFRVPFSQFSLEAESVLFVCSSLK
jgi:hypothetical protein